MTKKQYSIPEWEIIRIEVSKVVMQSGGGAGGHGQEGGGDDPDGAFFYDEVFEPLRK